MARKRRVQYAGAVNHVSNRGDHQQAVFRTEGPALFSGYAGGGVRPNGVAGAPLHMGTAINISQLLRRTERSAKGMPGTTEWKTITSINICN